MVLLIFYQKEQIQNILFIKYQMKQNITINQSRKNLQKIKESYINLLRRIKKSDQLKKFTQIFTNHERNQSKVNQGESGIQYGSKKTILYGIEIQSKKSLRKKRISLPNNYFDSKKSFNIYPVLEKKQYDQNLMRIHFKTRQATRENFIDNKRQFSNLGFNKNLQNQAQMLQRQSTIKKHKTRSFKVKSLNDKYPLILKKKRQQLKQAISSLQIKHRWQKFVNINELKVDQKVSYLQDQLSQKNLQQLDTNFTTKVKSFRSNQELSHRLFLTKPQQVLRQKYQPKTDQSEKITGWKYQQQSQFVLNSQIY